MIENYNVYHFSIKENVKYIVQGLFIAIILGSLFYESIIGMVCLSPVIYFYRRGRKKKLIEQRKWRLNQEFLDGLVSFAAAITAGYSVENAIEEARKDLKNLYDENSLIMQEFYYMNNQIRMNIRVEKAWKEFGERSKVEDIENFAEVFSTAKRTGGDLTKVVKTTCNTITDKIEVRREIKTLVTAKMYEANIMKMIPIGMLCYLKVSSPGYLDALYHNGFGIGFMTLGLGIYFISYRLIEKIVQIDI